MSRVIGHTLAFEGAAHDEHGNRLHLHTGNAGRGKCSCGELSDVLASGTARRAWHRKHKDDVAKAQARAEWPLRDRVAAVIDPEAFRWQAADHARDVARGKADDILELLAREHPSG